VFSREASAIHMQGTHGQVEFHESSQRRGHTQGDSRVHSVFLSHKTPRFEGKSFFRTCVYDGLFVCHKDVMGRIRGCQ
jgi:hypothetical protein